MTIILNPDPNKDFYTIDYRKKRDAELAEYIRQKAEELAKERGIVRRLADKLIQEREREREWYHGIGAQQWAQRVAENPGNNWTREREPPELSLEEAERLALDDALKEVYLEADAIGVRERPDLWRQHLDDVWMFLAGAEARPPAPQLTDADRELVINAYRIATAILIRAMAVESGEGEKPWTTSIERRPLGSIRTYLSSIVAQIDEMTEIKKAIRMSRDEQVVRLKPILQTAFKDARRIYLGHEELAGKRDWYLQRADILKAVQKALFETICDKALHLGILVNEKDAPFLAGLFERLVHEKTAPIKAAIQGVVRLTGVSEDAVKEGASERLKKGKKSARKNEPSRQEFNPPIRRPSPLGEMAYKLQLQRLSKKQ